MKYLLIFAMVVVHFGVTASRPAWSQNQALLVGEVRVVSIPFDIRSILSGSDSVVNLNAEGPRSVIITGLNPGRTNVIVLGSQNERRDFSLIVSPDQRDLVYIHQGASGLINFRCESRCDREADNTEGSSDISSALPSNETEAEVK